MMIQLLYITHSNFGGVTKCASFTKPVKHLFSHKLNCYTASIVHLENKFRNISSTKALMPHLSCVGEFRFFVPKVCILKIQTLGKTTNMPNFNAKSLF